MTKPEENMPIKVYRGTLRGYHDYAKGLTEWFTYPIYSHGIKIGTITRKDSFHVKN